MLFSLSALFLKKIRKIVSGKLLPCPHILGGLNFMGMKSDWILKGTSAACTKHRKYMKICFKLNEILDSNLYWKFRSIWTCFGNIIRKTASLPWLVFLIKFMLSLRIPGTSKVEVVVTIVKGFQLSLIIFTRHPS